MVALMRMTFVKFFQKKRSLISVCRWGFVFFAAVAFASVEIAAPTAAHAQRDSDDEEESRNRTFSPEVGELVQRAVELGEAEQYAEAIEVLERARNRRRVNEYEMGVILQVLGNFHYQQDDTSTAIGLWEEALSVGDLTQSERLALMFNIGQLYLVEGDYRTFIEKTEEWISLGGEPSDGVHLNLVAAYAELQRYRDALRHARQAYAKADPRERKHYDMLNFLFAELNLRNDRLQLLREMVGVFPTEKSIWLTLASLYAERGDTRRAFEINKIMYLNGMLEEEKEILRIVDYYSFYDAPYRGARILEREMNRQRVARTQENYERLARMYRQAREFGRAVDPLRQAARRSGDGELYKQLGEAFYSRGRLEEAEGALEQALESGGLAKPGDAWSLLAASRYERDEELGRYEARDLALEAYERALDYDHSRGTAEGWIEFINKEVETFRAREQFAQQVQRDEVRVICERYERDRLLASGSVDDGLGQSRGVPSGFVDDPRFEGVNCFELVENPAQYFTELEARRAEAAEALGEAPAEEVDASMSSDEEAAIREG